VSDDSKQVATQPLQRAVDIWGYALAAAAFLATFVDQFAPMFPDRWRPTVIAFGALCGTLAAMKTRSDVRKAANEFGEQTAPTHPKAGGS
jgi:hypothetical protein